MLPYKNKIIFTIQGDIPSMKNTLRIGKHGKFFHRSNVVARYKHDFALQVPAQYKKTIETTVRVGLIIYQKDHRRDAHNQAATVYDALEHAGVIKNDRQIVEWAGMAKLDHKNPRVTVVMEF